MSFDVPLVHIPNRRFLFRSLRIRHQTNGPHPAVCTAAECAVPSGQVEHQHVARLRLERIGRQLLRWNPEHRLRIGAAAAIRVQRFDTRYRAMQRLAVRTRYHAQRASARGQGIGIDGELDASVIQRGLVWMP